MCYLYKSKYGQSGGLLRNIMLTFAQFERELTSERTKDKMLQRAQKGMWNGGVVLFGLFQKNPAYP
ncbi:recombinase family protein [bacterium]|nr:recombinase family protein [bacterium]